MDDYEARVAALRADAEKAKAAEKRNPGAAYFASWLLFYMDETDKARAERDNVVLAARWLVSDAS